MMEDDRAKLRRMAIMTILHQVGSIDQRRFHRLFYMIQEGLEIPTDFRFKMLHQSPFSDELDDGISYIKGLVGGIGFSYHEEGYRILDAEIPELWQEGREFDKMYPRVRAVASALNKYPDGFFHVHATLLMVLSLKNKDDQVKRLEDVVNIISNLMPKFTRRLVLDAYENLGRFGLLEHRYSEIRDGNREVRE